MTVVLVMLFVLVELGVELISLLVQFDPIFVGIEGVTILFSSSPPDALCVRLGLDGVKESQDDATGRDSPKCGWLRPSIMKGSMAMNNCL